MDPERRRPLKVLGAAGLGGLAGCTGGPTESTLLFAGPAALQIVLQLRDVAVPNQLIRVTPFVMVIVVLALVGRTRIPSAAGEHYESGEE
jgi:hypothetical protein